MELENGKLYWIKDTSVGSGVVIGEYWDFYFYVVGKWVTASIREIDAEVLGEVEFVVPDYAKGYGYDNHS